MIEVIARHNDATTEVAIYLNYVLIERYTVHPEDGDWRKTIPAGAVVREYAEGAS